MARVTVYKIKRYHAHPEGEETIPDRWFTRQGAKIVEATHVYEESAVDIDEQDLENGNPWTAHGYQPR